MPEAEPSNDPAVRPKATADDYLAVGCGFVMALFGIVLIPFGIVLAATEAWLAGTFPYEIVAGFAVVGIVLVAVGLNLRPAAAGPRKGLPGKKDRIV